MSQPCNDCQLDKAESDFYIQTTGQLFKQCKQCILKNKKRVIKPKGFAALDPQVQKDLLTALQGREKLVTLAKRFELNYSTLQNWVRLGKIVPH